METFSAFRSETITARVTSEQEMMVRKSGRRSGIGHKDREGIYARTDLIDLVSMTSSPSVGLAVD